MSRAWTTSGLVGVGLGMLLDGLDAAQEVGAAVVELADAEAALARDLDVHAAVVVGLDLGDAGDGADEIRLGGLANLGTVADEGDAEGAVGPQAIVDHPAVPVLEDVEAQRRVREEDGPQGEERQLFEAFGHARVSIRREGDGGW